MKKKHIITIAGRPGSGKSTASKGVAEQLGYEHFSSGDLFRAIGRERGMDVHQTNLAGEKQADVDHLVDQRLREIGATQEEVAIDSRMAWHWIPDSFKVFLNLDLEVAARRILQNMEPERVKHEHIPSDPQEYATRLQDRLASEARRYKKLYDVDPYDADNYDLVVDTGARGPSEVQQQILDAYHMWLAG
ncbi:MAG TPA: nucleoside monophosphate kinase [Candidatus Limnocylindria bacterium]|nr:nucleoside monophosphate kinase [Candidatus Limnocylindria bacterium]